MQLLLATRCRNQVASTTLSLTTQPSSPTSARFCPPPPKAPPPPVQPPPNPPLHRCNHPLWRTRPRATPSGQSPSGPPLQPPPNQPPPQKPPPSLPPPPFQAVPPPPHAPCDDSCSGSLGSGTIVISISTRGRNFDFLDGGSSTPAIKTPVAVSTFDFGNTPPAVFTDVSAAATSYVAASALVLTQTPADSSGSALFFAPDSGTLAFPVSGPAPSGSVYMISGAQAMGCSASDAWQAATGAAARACTWRATPAGLYARYDAVSNTAATSALRPENWGGIYGLYLFKKAEVVVPSSTVTVDPANATSIQGVAGSTEMGGVCGYAASVSGTEGVTGFAAYYPGEIHPVNTSPSVSGEGGSRRKLLSTERTVPVASGLLFLKQGNRTYGPDSGSLMFGGVSDAGVDSFSLSAFQYNNCTPRQLDSVTGFDGCVWTQVPHSITLNYNATAQTMVLENLGKGMCNNVYMLLSVSSVPPPPPPPPAITSSPPRVNASGSSGGFLVPLLGAIAGVSVVSGLVFIAAGGRCKSRRD
ncbi:hypothetical protein KFL_006850040 [Klebsormidium nitens]|uniref:Uncharacterized protein n=1 Tax=Klebsormidium nitens TaxID=105231 RepID=A0A1Y1IIU5_KLENI|nr:hypothetical protein KFL_006850040 [Klebsormidium nitens]|eukprot:GAQ90790.1 hypothetical protein KFL_006850040 [Klebsormidium nitens]